MSGVSGMRRSSAERSPFHLELTRATRSVNYEVQMQNRIDRRVRTCSGVCFSHCKERFIYQVFKITTVPIKTDVHRVNWLIFTQSFSTDNCCFNQCCWSGFLESRFGCLSEFSIPSESDPSPGFWWPKLTKKIAEKIYFLMKNCNLQSLDVLKGRPSNRRSLQPSKENIQHFKQWNLLTSFYFCASFCPPRSRWIRIHNTGFNDR